MKKLAKMLVLFFLFVIPKAYAADFEIITYDVKANISIDRIADINEKYNIYFINDVPILKRTINKKINIIRPNKSRRTISGIIEDSNVDKSFTSTINNKEKILEIEANASKDTVEEYNVNYKYNYGKDTGVGFDELYIELVDGSFDATISSLTFEVTLPKTFDTSKISFAYDSKYDLNEEDVTYEISSNTITGSLNRTLPGNTKFQMYIEFDDNYFIGASDNYNYMLFLILILPIITIIFSIICFKKYKYKNKVKVEITREIPYNFSSSEIGYLYKGYLKEHDLMTMLVRLANMGYIMFEELDDGYKLDKENSFKIIKLKDYDLENASEKIIFDKLFQLKDDITIADIEYNLYDTLVEAKGTLDNKENHDKMFFTDLAKNKMILAVLGIISLISVNAYSIYLYTSSIIFIPIIVAVLAFGIFIFFIAHTHTFVKILFGLGFIAGTMYIGIMPIINDSKTLIIYIVGMILILISVIIYKNLPYRTKLGNEYLGKMYGFKSGMESLTISELDQILKDNPNYFYEMYPYMYVLDDLDLWITKCSNFIKNYPSWYITKEEFSINKFQKFVKNMIFTVTQAMFKKQLEGQSKTHVEYKRDTSMDWLEK